MILRFNYRCGTRAKIGISIRDQSVAGKVIAKAFALAWKGPFVHQLTHNPRTRKCRNLPCNLKSNPYSSNSLAQAISECGLLSHSACSNCQTVIVTNENYNALSGYCSIKGIAPFDRWPFSWFVQKFFRPNKKKQRKTNTNKQRHNHNCVEACLNKCSLCLCRKITFAYVSEIHRETIKQDLEAHSIYVSSVVQCCPGQLWNILPTRFQVCVVRINFASATTIGTCHIRFVEFRI